MSAYDPAAILAAHGRSFHWASRLLGPVHATRATKLYAFCRHIDDLADEARSPEAARAALCMVTRDIAAGASKNPAVADLLALMAECGIEPATVADLIEGVASDLDPVRIADDAALLRYCYHVAGTVGLMMCRVLDVDTPAAFPHAVDLGIGMQLSNICRDITEDARADRRYLPASRVGDLPPAALVAPDPALQPVLCACVRHLLDAADAYYASGERGLAYLPLGARTGILVAARVYRAIGTRLRRRGLAYWDGRVVVRRRAKVGLTARALLTAPVGPSFWRPTGHHDPALHASLTGLRHVG